MDKKIQVKWNTGGEDELFIEERVYSDRSCGQYESGWVAFRSETDDEDYFISDEGIVYVHGTSDEVGKAPVLVEQAERMEREIDEAYAQGGM